MTDTRQGADTNQAAPLKLLPKGPSEEKHEDNRTKPRQKKLGRKGGGAGDEHSVGGKRLEGLRGLLLLDKECKSV